MFSIKQKSSTTVQHLQKDINIAISKDDILSVQRLLKDGANVNDKDIEGRTPLHYAVIRGNIDIVNILLQNGADVTQVTDHGDTPLHTACSKGHKEIVDVLLQHISRDKLNTFVNAKSFYSGGTALHLAAKSGSFEVLKSLLRYGAIYNTGNVEDVAPIALAKDQKVIALLRLIEELYEDSKNGNVQTTAKLRVIQGDELLAILNTRNSQGHTLLQVAIVNRHKDIADQLLQMLKEQDGEQKLHSLKCELDHLQSLKNASELHLVFSELYLPMLRNMSQPYHSVKNLSPWRTLKEGSYYLGNAFSLVKIYKECLPGPIDNTDIQLVNDTLAALEFNPNHMSSGYTDEAYCGEVECFVSKGQGTKYYNLLHSELRKDVRSFIELVELNIDKPVMRFLESVKQRLKSVSLKNVTEPREIANDLKGENNNMFPNVPDNAPQLHVPKCGLNQLQSLKNASELHLEFSGLYLPMLRDMSQPYHSVKNLSPWRTLKEGSYYLGNAFSLVKIYKECLPGPIDNTDIQLVNDTLAALEFNPNHISNGYTDEAYCGEVECFVSKGQGTKYYNLLHSELRKDVRSFIELVELNIDKPVMRFLTSVDRSLNTYS